jgi:hypothetical protein
MPTRFSFDAASSPVPDVTTSFSASWNTTTDAVRRRLCLPKSTSAITTGATISWTAGQKGLDRQYVSDPLDAGAVFTSGSTTVQMQLMTREFATTDNVNLSQLGIRVFDLAGTTLRATLLAVGNYFANAEFINNATCRNCTFANGDTVTASYTTVLDDRLVVEVGYSDSSGTTPQAAAKWGENATDLPINETQTTDGAGWIEFSNTIALAPSLFPPFPARQNTLLRL